MTTRVLTGLKPTGSLQIGNYLTAVRPLCELARDPANEVLVCVADLHALTVDHDPARVHALSLELAATLVACGLDPAAHLFVQSSVPAHTELSYLLESTATYGEMTRMVQFKEKSTGTGTVRLSLLTYPALMAADVLVHGAQLVPVGEDQRQHLELTTTLARRFNARYGDVFVVPRAMTPKAGARLMDLRDPSAKMGRSGAAGCGVVHLLDSPDVIAATVRRAVTDPDPVLDLDPEGRPGVANLATLLGALTGRPPQDALIGLRGSGALKQAVTDALVDTLEPVRRRYGELAADRAELERLLRAGRDAVAPGAQATVAAARHAMGLVAVE